jgi:hypothetical protein
MFLHINNHLKMSELLICDRRRRSFPYLGNDWEHAPRIASPTILQGLSLTKSKNVSWGTTYWEVIPADPIRAITSGWPTTLE